jgi:hypothetical protein
VEASNLLAGRARAAVPCVCVVAVDVSSRPAGLVGLGQPASRARGFGTSLSGFSPPLTAAGWSKTPQSHVARSLKSNPLERIGSESTGCHKVSAVLRPIGATAAKK